MSALDEWRNTARGLIPRGFLRRDQGNGLFVSDYPRHPDAESVTEALRKAGFSVDAAGSVMKIGVSPEQMDALAVGLKLPNGQPTDENLYVWALGRRLIRFGGPVTKDTLPLACFALKCLDAGDQDRLIKTLPPRLALFQRLKHPLPAAVGKLIMGGIRD